MNNEETAKRKVRADPHRVMAWLDHVIQKRPVQYSLAGLLVLILAIILGPSLWARDSILDRLKVGERAEGNIKAARDFDYMPTDERLEQQRAEAEEKILPVFDYQSDMGTIIVSRISRAFDAMIDAGGHPGKKVNTDGRRGKDPSLKRVPPASTAEPATRDTREMQRKEFSEMLQADIFAENFTILRKNAFSVEVRSSLLVIIGSAQGQFIVSQRNVLEPFEDRPVVVRHLVGGQPGRGGEEKISNFRRIKDLLQVREEIRALAKVHAAKFPPELANVIVTIAQKLIAANLIFNRTETEARAKIARDSIQPRPVTVVKGQVIVRDGDPITKEHLNMIQAMESWRKSSNVFQEIFGIGFFVLLLLAVVFSFAKQQFLRFYKRPRDIVVISVLLLALLGLSKGVMTLGGGVGRGPDLPIYLYVIPLAAGAMLTRLLISAEASVLFAVVLSSLCGMLVDKHLGMMLFYLVTSLVGAAGVAQVQSRSTVLRAGLSAGLIGGILLLGMRLYQGQFAEFESVYAVLGAVAGGVLASFLTLALLPAMEWLFAYTTDVTLLELANLNHPLLRDLILRAPGTYHHSMVVGSLSETACEAIGANGLLARVASYYHDIGKVKNALYFAENFKPGENPHNRLKPSMSALIIRSHVKDTIEMLQEHGIPELVIDTATQHHGKTLIEFFYHKAKEHKEEDEDVHEEDYRYPGPKPQTREAGAIMLADGVEAAARSLAESTEDRLRAVVQRVINGKFTDGQLDHCDLTLRDLHLIAKSFLQVLRGIYHQRPTYPWQQVRKEETKRETSKLRAIEREAEPKEEPKGKVESAKDTKKNKQDTQSKDGKKNKTERPEAKDAKREAEKKPSKNGNQPEEDKTKKTKRKDPPTGKTSDKPPSEGVSAQEPDADDPPEDPPESNQDLKRLGLS